MSKEDLIPLKPGNTLSKDFYASLSPEEREARRVTMKLKRDMKKQMKQLILAQSEGWLAKLNNTADLILNKALEEGDTQAFCAVWDRIVGKPMSQIQADVDSDSKVEIEVSYVNPTTEEDK